MGVPLKLDEFELCAVHKDDVGQVRLVVGEKLIDMLLGDDAFTKVAVPENA